MFDMAFLGGKRIETIPVKFSQEEKREIIRIGEKEDRPMGYVIRELMLRGLAHYLSDESLRPTNKEIKLAQTALDRASNGASDEKRSPKIIIEKEKPEIIKKRKAS